MKKHYLVRRIKNFKTGDDQCHVEAYPKHGKHDRSDIDVLRLTLVSHDEKTGGKEKFVMDMTPDEAIEVANTLNTAAMFWLMNYKPYWDTMMKRKRDINKKLSRKTK